MRTEIQRDFFSCFVFSDQNPFSLLIYNFSDRSNFFENMLNPVQEPAFIGPQGNKVIQCPAATGNDTDDVS